MSEMPKFIWAWETTDPETGKPFGFGEWYTEDVGLDGDETEYVRCDELERLRAENARLRAALEKIHQYAIVMPVSRLPLEKRGVWEMAIEGAAMHVQKAARATLQPKGGE